jgi:hypothetical protein
MEQFSFDIETTTFDLIKQGVTAGRFFGAQQNHQRVVVLADNMLEGMLIACQIGGCFGRVMSCHPRI